MSFCHVNKIRPGFIRNGMGIVLVSSLGLLLVFLMLSG